MDSSGGPDRGIRQTHFQIIQQDGGHLGKHGCGNLGDQQEMGWNTIREYWDGSSKDKWSRCGDVIKAVDKGSVSRYTRLRFSWSDALRCKLRSTDVFFFNETWTRAKWKRRVNDKRGSDVRHDFWHVTLLGAHMHSLGRSPAARRWAVLGPRHVACCVFFHSVFFFAVNGGGRRRGCLDRNRFGYKEDDIGT